MQNEDVYNALYDRARDMLEQQLSFELIYEKLQKEGADPLTASEVVSQLKMVHYARKRKRGSQIILFGSLFLLIGFICTCAFFHSGMPIHWVLYGFTTLGLIIIFIGLYDIFG
ncbi:MAG: hypothetical protein JST26_02415 [Bacteroidetes bacterium]|nr:hypothetical protein [Bacteroidota bacterium]